MIHQNAPAEDLQQFVSLLRRCGELQEISAPVDPRLEIAEIHRRVIEQQGKALLFTNVKGSSFPLVTNLFGTPQRVAMAFGSAPENMVREIARLPEELMPPSIGKLWEKRSLMGRLLKVGLKRNSSAAVAENFQRPARLGSLPLLTTWEQDGGAFITLPLVYTEHPRTKQHNLGMYRIQRFDDTSSGLHCQIGKGGGFHLACARELGQKLPVHVYIGGPPALILSAIAPLPENVPELLLASLVLGKRLALAKNPYGSLPLIANAEFALLGEVDPHETRPEGPFGDHYGYYSLQHDYPVVRYHTLLHRKNAICAATVVGKPRQEDFYLGDYLQQLLSPLFPLVMPAVEDLWSYGETGYHSLAAAVVKQRYKREAMVSAFRILGEGQLALTKFLLVLDKRQDLKDFRSVLQYVLERCDFRSDLYVLGNLSMDTLDYTGPRVNEGSKGILLGCGEAIRELPKAFSGSLPIGLTQAEVFCPGCLVLSGESATGEARHPQRFTEHPDFAAWPLLVLVDDAKKCAHSSMSFLWTTFTRFEPAAHIYARRLEVLQNHLSYQAPLLIDARLKPGFPEELECDAKTKALVDLRWHEYFG